VPASSSFNAVGVSNGPLTALGAQILDEFLRSKDLDVGLTREFGDAGLCRLASTLNWWTCARAGAAATAIRAVVAKRARLDQENLSVTFVILLEGAPTAPLNE